MTAAEIREYMEEHLIKGTLSDQQVGLRMLCEIAAHLAEMNAHSNPVGDLYVGRIAGERFDASYKKLLLAGERIIRAFETAERRISTGSIDAAIAAWRELSPL
jgi:hypothetical protein